MPVRGSLLFRDLRERVELAGEAALFASCGVLMKNTLRDSFVYLLYGFLVGSVCGFLVAGRDSRLVLLERSFERSFYHFVSETFALGDLDALLCGFDVRQDFHLPIIVVFFRQVIMIPYLSAKINTFSDIFSIIKFL